MASHAQLSMALIVVGDLNASVSFYTEVLGLEVADRNPTAALLAGADRTPLILRSMGASAARAPGSAGVEFVDAVAAAVPAASARTLVGLAGSVTTVTAIGLGLQVYDPQLTHHARLSAEQVRRVTNQLLEQSHDERAQIGALHPGRVDVIGAGALILDRLMERFGFDEVVTSEHDILDGIAWSIAGHGSN